MVPGARRLAPRHLSIRVPWHDGAEDGLRLRQIEEPHSSRPPYTLEGPRVDNAWAGGG